MLQNLTFKGNEMDVVCPSGRKVRIRENTGDDEATLSKVKDLKGGRSVMLYLSSIILNDYSKGAADNRVTPEEIAQWHNRDKWYLMFKARILSLGPIFKYNGICLNDKCRHMATFEEDLAIYDNEFLENGTVAKEVENPSEYQITPYPGGSKKVHEFTLSSGKKVRFQILTSALEAASLDLPEDAIDRNRSLTIRELEIYNDSGANWDRVYTYRMFSSREMAQLRGEVTKADEEWAPVSEATCPKCKEVTPHLVMNEGDFFFPEEI